MGSTGIETSCDWFTTFEVPDDGNGWIGTNVSGYSSPAFDAACQSAQQSFPDETVHAEAYFQVQSIFSEELPVLPLYWRVKVAAARSDLCNFKLDPTSSASLWNIEQVDSGAGCLP
jgi:peptide/nickel transport system substrate-binding protein